MDGNSAARTHPTYVLVTPARNEARFIGDTLASVVGQTVLPARWIIVSDGSSDDTDEIVREYAARHGWIELVRMPDRADRHFAGKVQAFKAGYARLQGIPFEVIGSLDADISFERDYMAFLLSKFINPKLGIAGTPFKEAGETYDFRFSATEHVSGACQLFRKACYESIGGYHPVQGGGIDVIAVLSARMQGWETRTFVEKYCVHNREEGTATGSVLRARFRDGRKDYRLGAHPMWELFRGMYQMTRRPVVVGGMAILCGYLWNVLRNADRSMSEELVRFRRKDQMRRLRQFFGKVTTLRMRGDQ